MLQEIVTYIIIAAAVCTAVWKIVIRLKNKRKKNSPECKLIKPSVASGCADCTADCIFREEYGKAIVNQNSESK